MKVVKIVLCTLGALFIALIAVVLLTDDSSSDYTNGGQFADVEDLHGSPFSKSYGNYDGTWEPPAKKGAFTKAWSWSDSDECIAYAYTDDDGEESYSYASSGMDPCEAYAMYQEIAELLDYIFSMDADQAQAFLSGLSREERRDFLGMMEFADEMFGDQLDFKMKESFEEMFALLDSGAYSDDGDDDDGGYGQGYAQSDDDDYDDDDDDDDYGQEYAQSDDDDDDYGAQVAQADDDDEDYEEEAYTPSGSGAVAASDEEESFRPGGSGATIATGNGGSRPSGGSGNGGNGGNSNRPSGNGGGNSEVASGEPYEDEFLANFGSLVL